MVNYRFKARSMVLSFLVPFPTGVITFDEAKKCALIGVNEILDCLSKYKGMHDQEFFDADIAYYNNIKKEIENL